MTKRANTPALHRPKCEKCGNDGSVRIEHVDGSGPGFKCSVCSWWNWLPAIAFDGVLADHYPAQEDVERASELARERGWKDIQA